MSLGLDLNVGMKLEQKLSPQMIQSLKLLQVNALQLEAMVQQELEVNPLLEKQEDIEEIDVTEERAKEQEVDEAGDLKELSAEESKEEIDWEKFFEDGFDPGFRRSEDPGQERFERVPVASKSLQDHLYGQLQFRHLSEEVRFLVEYLIDNLDDDGYLRIGEMESEQLITIEEHEGVSEVQQVLLGQKEELQASKNVREAFSALRHLDPAGIGARSLQECLLLQMYRYGNCSPLAQEIVETAYDLLEKIKVAALAKKFEVPPEEVQRAMKEIGALEPRPGRVLNESVSATIVPDLLVEVVDGEILLLFNEKHAPSLRISRSYSNLLKKGSSASTEEKKYVRDRLNSASWLIRAIEQRKSSMIKVMNAIIERQPDFFAKGPTHLKPLILQDVADKIEMHISTVSRVINGKYVQTPHGVFELKYFFASGVVQNDGSDISSIQVKRSIQELVENENPKKPLSDQKIVEQLETKGIKVARRTVAKYRDQLEILPARMRKKF